MAWLGRVRVAAPQLMSTRLCRAYGSAAAVELDYHYGYGYDEEQVHLDRYRAEAMVDASGSAPARGVQWVLIGEPGAKRHAYAERLSKLLEVPHISMGALVRQELNRHSSLYKQIARALNEGKLVPEDVIFALLSKRLEEGYYSGENGFILDGIPRTRIQAEILDQMADIDLVVNFKCTEEQLVKNPEDRSLSSGQEHLTFGNPHVHPEQGKLLEEYYRKQRKLVDFKVTGAAGDSWQGLLAALHLQHMNPSQKLTA